MTVRPTIDTKHQDEDHPVCNELLQFVSSQGTNTSSKKKGKTDWENPEVDFYTSHLDSHVAQEAKKNIYNTTSGADCTFFHILASVNVIHN